MIMNTTDPIIDAYIQVLEESNDEDLANIWRHTANQPWHEYIKKINGLPHQIKQQQGEDSPENAESKKRVDDYLKKYKHLF